MPEVVGKYMRATVVASLRAVAAKEKEDAASDEEEYEEGIGDDLSVCCHGRAAGPEVQYIDFLPARSPGQVQYEVANTNWCGQQ